MSKLFVVCLVGLLVVSVFVGVVPVVRGATVISSYPYTISSSGDYVVGTGGYTDTATAIMIHADNVNLDGANVEISGSGANDGVTVWGNYNVNITNMNLVDFNIGVRSGNIGNSSRVYVSTSVFSSCDFAGVSLSYLYNSTVRNCTFYANPLYGCLMRYSTYCLLDNVKVYGVSTYGIIYDFDCSYLVAQNCFTSGCSGVGFISDGENFLCTYKDSISLYDSQGVKWQTDSMQLGNLVSNVNVSYPTGGAYGFQVSNAVNVTFVKCNVVGSGAGLAEFGITGTSSNVTIQQCSTNGGVFGISDFNSAGNCTYAFNYLVDATANYIFSNSANVNVLHNAYSGGVSNSLSGSGLVLNDSVVDLVVSKVGSGTISPVVGTHGVNGGNWSVAVSAVADSGYALGSITYRGVSQSLGLSRLEVLGDGALVFTFTLLPVEVTFTSTFTGAGFIIVNGTARSTPYVVVSAVVGDVYNLTANTPVSLVTGVSRYVFVEWGYGESSSSEDNPFMFTVPMGGDTVTGVYQLEYSVSTSCDDYSTISPLGVTWVVSGGSLEVTYSASGLYEISFCRVDGDLVDITGSYDFVNVVGSHSVAVGTSTPVPSGSATPAPSGGIGLGGVLYLGLDLPTIIILIVILMFVFLVVLPLAKRL